MIDLKTAQLTTVQAILKSNVADVPAFVFGSRAIGKAKKYSDLNIALMPAQPLNWWVLADQRKAFETPSLPIPVDVIDGSTASPGFQAAVKSQWVKLGTS